MIRATVNLTHHSALLIARPNSPLKTAAVDHQSP